ncbi:MAG: GTP-binding protein, partial [Candidatus Auribacterota bacterium]|nr:GTP-binding protein [Candidatus Auribacterota bacterium]
MDKVNVSEVRNCIVVGHGTCGKTTLVDSLMHKSGANDRFGRVDNGSSLSDYTGEEKERKISIFSAPLHLMWKNHSVFITDTPGYADFFGEAVGSMRVSDSAIVVIDASSGVGVGTHRTWDEADKYGIGRVIFVTRLDKEHADFLKTCNDLVSEFGKKCVPVTLPVGKENEIKDVANIITGQKVDQLEEPLKEMVPKYKEALIEAVAESDDALLEKYFDKGELSDEELKSGLKNAIIKGTVVPVLAGSGDREIGSQELLDFIADYMPSPADLKPLEIDGKE